MMKRAISKVARSGLYGVIIETTTAKTSLVGEQSRLLFGALSR